MTAPALSPTAAFQSIRWNDYSSVITVITLKLRQELRRHRDRTRAVDGVPPIAPPAPSSVVTAPLHRKERLTETREARSSSVWAVGDFARTERSDRLGKREQLGLVAQQVPHVPVEARAFGAQGLTPRRSSSRRSTANARWKRIFAAGSLIASADAISRNEQP